MKRAGRGHVPNGIATTKAGELAVKCWACPQPGVNIPANWQETTPPEQMYALLVCQSFVNSQSGFYSCSL